MITTFDAYDKGIEGTAKYPLCGRNMVYPALKLAGEAGELADKIGKHWRNTFNAAAFEVSDYDSQSRATLGAMNADSVEEAMKIEMMKELGDVLWYVNALAKELGGTLQQVAELNVKKVQDRRQRGVTCSTGDNR